ncbi:hypothetical protein Peur_058164 [Populus x canadensis]
MFPVKNGQHHDLKARWLCSSGGGGGGDAEQRSWVFSCYEEQICTDRIGMPNSYNYSKSLVLQYFLALYYYILMIMFCCSVLLIIVVCDWNTGFYGGTLSWLVLTRSRHKCRPSQIAQGSSVCDHCSEAEIKSLCRILFKSTCFLSYI